MALIQIGVMALRSPTGEFLPSQPIYKEIPDDQMASSGRTKEEEKAINDISKVLALKFKEYFDKCNETGLEV